MSKLSTFRAALIFISGTLALTSVACSSDRLSTDARDNTQLIATVPATSAAPDALDLKRVKPNSTQVNPYELALDKARSAVSISQSAQSSDDWNLVVSQWQEAIALMKSVLANSSYQAIAKTKISEYQRNLIYAQQQANYLLKDESDNEVKVMPDQPSTPVIASRSAAVEALPPVSPNESVFQATIKRRVGGTPVIDVTFNGSQKFEMIVDTGASATVITQQAAVALGVVPVTKAKANTASAKAVEFPIGYVKSIDVNGAAINNVPIAIAGPELEIGLLGHDFFGGYDVTIKSDVVEFRTR